MGRLVLGLALVGLWGAAAVPVAADDMLARDVGNFVQRERSSVSSRMFRPVEPAALKERRRELKGLRERSLDATTIERLETIKHNAELVLEAARSTLESAPESVSELEVPAPTPKAFAVEDGQESAPDASSVIAAAAATLRLPLLTPDGTKSANARLMAPGQEGDGGGQVERLDKDSRDRTEKAAQESTEAGILLAFAKEVDERAKTTEQLVAVDSARQELAVVARRQATSLFSQALRGISSAGFRLRESMAEQRRPARFTYTRNWLGDENPDADGNAFQTQMALTWTALPLKKQWKVNTNRTITLHPEFTFEADIDPTRDPTESAPNVYSLYGGIQIMDDQTPVRYADWFDYVGRGTKLFQWKALLKYTNTESFGREDYAVEFIFTPNVGAWAMGVRRGHETNCFLGPNKSGDRCFQCAVPRNAISFMWQPQLTYDIGETVRHPDASEEGFLTRWTFDIWGRVYFDGLARGLFRGSKKGEIGTLFDSELMPYVQLGWKYYWEPTANDKAHRLFKAALYIPLNDNIGIDTKYEHGNVWPTYKDIRQLTVALSVQI